MRKLRGRPFGNRENPSCKDVATVLQSFLDGEIEDRDVDAVRKHLDACRDCGLEAETYTAVKESLQNRRPEIEPGMLERLREFSSRVGSAELD